MNVLFAELKPRKVVRVAAVYAATGFVVLQATELLAAGLALPASTAAGPLAAVGGERGAPSLVVLPFADLSEAGDRAYFADGVAEEVLNLLGSTDGNRRGSRIRRDDRARHRGPAPARPCDPYRRGDRRPREPRPALLSRGSHPLLGASEQTLRLLEAQPDWYLQVDRPEFDFVRDDPRFQVLMAPLRTSGSGPRGCPARGRGSREA